MRIFSKSTLKAFWEKHPETQTQLQTWCNAHQKADWKSPADIKKGFDPKASVLKAGRMVYDVCGGAYRLIAEYNFAWSAVFVKFIGTHQEYDQIDANTVEIKKSDKT